MRTASQGPIPNVQALLRQEDQYVTEHGCVLGQHAHGWLKLCGGFFL